MHCSPQRAGLYRKAKTCLSKQSLLNMAKAYNVALLSQKLEGNDQKEHVGGYGSKIFHNPKIHKPIPLSGTRATLWKHLQKRFMHLCDNESCWLEIDFIKQSVDAENEFRPKKPVEWNSNPHTWLNNFNIDDVMQQYEEKHPSFNFIGVFPMDFAAKDGLGRCISEEMCKLDVRKLMKSGIMQMGAVLNLDKHTESGSHWVAVYANFDPNKPNYGIYYYDSNGIGPTKEVLAFKNNIKKQMDAMDPNAVKKFQMDHNKRRHQYGNSECGMFCMYFIERCLQGMSFKTIESSKVYDKAVHKLRNAYFRPNK